MTETKTEIERMKSFYDDVYYANANKTLQGSTHLRKLSGKVGVSQDMLVLDIACGSLRLVVKAIPYLDKSHYLGIEKEEKCMQT